MTQICHLHALDDNNYSMITIIVIIIIMKHFSYRNDYTNIITNSEMLEHSDADWESCYLC